MRESPFPRSLLCGLRKEGMKWDGEAPNEGPGLSSRQTLGFSTRVPGACALSSHVAALGPSAQVACLSGEKARMPSLFTELRAGWGWLVLRPWSHPTLFLQEKHVIPGLCAGHGDGHSEHTRIPHLKWLPVLGQPENTEEVSTVGMDLTVPAQT